jgi:hypothetical protein
MEKLKRERMAHYAFSFLGVPYYWGGDDSFFMDCSGFCIEIAKSVSLLPHKYDNNAHGLWELWRRGERDEDEPAQAGDFVFYFKDDYASHIEMAFNESQVIGASGGGRPQFDLYEEMKKDKILSSYYGEMDRARFYAEAIDDYAIKQLKHFLIKDEAIRRNAFIKIRPIGYRANSKIVNPFYHWEI